MQNTNIGLHFSIYFLNLKIFSIYFLIFRFILFIYLLNFIILNFNFIIIIFFLYLVPQCLKLKIKNIYTLTII